MIPRVLGVIITLFMAMMSLDAIGEFYGWKLVLALLIHNIPTLILLAVLVIAWKREDVGGWIYLILGIATMIFFQTYKEIYSFLIITAPIAITGTLFLIGHRMDRMKEKTKSKTNQASKEA